MRRQVAFPGACKNIYRLMILYSLQAIPLQCTRIAIVDNNRRTLIAFYMLADLSHDFFRYFGCFMITSASEKELFLLLVKINQALFIFLVLPDGQRVKKFISD